MKLKVKPESEQLGVQGNATDILETSEVLRSANCMTRMASGILGFANQLCKAEVLSEERMKKVNESLDVVLDAYKEVYAALLARYSALESASTGSKSSN